MNDEFQRVSLPKPPAQHFQITCGAALLRDVKNQLLRRLRVICHCCGPYVVLSWRTPSCRVNEEHGDLTGLPVVFRMRWAKDIGISWKMGWPRLSKDVSKDTLQLGIQWMRVDILMDFLMLCAGLGARS